MLGWPVGMWRVVMASTWATLPSLLLAGGGPYNVLLVVNQNSASSLRVANEYIRLRDIPPQNVVHVNYKGGLDQCPVARFRSEILGPVLKTIDDRKLALQIDYVAYSVDLPWRIQLQQDFPEQKFPKNLLPYASITGCTYLYADVMAKRQTLMSPVANDYVPGLPTANLGPCQKLDECVSSAFRSRYFWQPGAKKASKPTEGSRYLLSTMLGVTSGRGMTVDQVLANLNRAAQADATHPQGSFYFMRNKDIRSATRDKCFAAAVAMLEREGAQAKIIDGVLPNGAQDVLGITTGQADLGIAAAGMQFVPGALGDNLTSYGGDFLKTSQTPLTHFLAAGAAGASGTVFEPTAQQCKFPLPTLHVHYRRGCSLAESFYQSVRSPYQLLIVGDPLCQPWAKRPTVTLAGVEAGQEVAGVVTITPQVTPAEGTTLGPCEVFLDGQLIARMAADRAIPLDTAKLPAGCHHLAVVATTGDFIESQGVAEVSFVIAGREDQPVPKLTVTPDPVVASGQPMTATVAGVGEGDEVEIVQAGRVVARLAAGTASTSVATEPLGRGPVGLRARVARTGVESCPVWVVIQ